MIPKPLSREEEKSQRNWDRLLDPLNNRGCGDYVRGISSPAAADYRASFMANADAVCAIDRRRFRESMQSTSELLKSLCFTEFGKTKREREEKEKEERQDREDRVYERRRESQEKSQKAMQNWLDGGCKLSSNFKISLK
jgi:hypothetical protein